ASAPGSPVPMRSASCLSRSRSAARSRSSAKTSSPGAMVCRSRAAGHGETLTIVRPRSPGPEAATGCRASDGLAGQGLKGRPGRQVEALVPDEPLADEVAVGVYRDHAHDLASGILGKPRARDRTGKGERPGGAGGIADAPGLPLGGPQNSVGLVQVTLLGWLMKYRRR